MLDADMHGGVKVSNTYSKDVAGYAKVACQVSLETNILDIAEKIAAQTKTTWDDTAIKALKSLLGIV